MAEKGIQRGGLPEVIDIVGNYRLHVDRVANGEEPRPLRSVLIEFNDTGVPVVHIFGLDEPSYRERLALVTEVMQTLSHVAAGMNARASN